MTRLPRSRDLEILDTGTVGGAPVPPDVLARSLAHVEAVDRWLGGARALRRALERRLPEAGPVRILDVGTGNGRLLRRLVGRLRETGRAGRGVGIEIDAASATIAASETARAAARGRSTATTFVRADGLRLPLADDSVDVALCVLTLHHFDDTAAVALLGEMARVARTAVVVSDLRRSVPAWLGARLLAATVWRSNPVTRHDGPLSVLRSFTPSELAHLGREAGLEGVVVRPAPLFRLVLEATP